MAKPILRVRALQRKNPKTASMEWYFNKDKYSTIGDAQLIAAIQRNSNVPSGVVRGAVEAICDSVANFIANGHSIKVDGLFTLRPVLHSSGVATTASPKIENIKKVLVRASWDPSMRTLQSPDNYEFVADLSAVTAAQNVANSAAKKATKKAVTE